METHNLNKTQSDIYNILITPSSTHFNPTLVVMISAMLNCKKYCRFFIMQSEWTDEQKRTCEDVVSEYPGHKVEFINVDNSVFSSFACFKLREGHYENNFRLLAHNYLPDDVERIAYLDTDTLVRKDIASFYNIDLEDVFLSASIEALFPFETKHEDYAKQVDEIEPSSSYFNSGVMMLNVKKFRENKIAPEFYDEAVKKARYKPGLTDQGIFNLLFWNQAKFVPFYYYNFFVGSYEWYREIRKIHNTTDEQERAKAYHSVYTEDFDENKFASIVHFCYGDLRKPWQAVVKDGALMGNGVGVGQYYCVEAEPFYLEWWEIAQRLPQKCYEELAANALNEYCQNSLKLLTRMTDTKNFFESLVLDYYNGSRKFDNFIQNIKNKKLSILNSDSDIGKFFTQIAEQNGIDIVFKNRIGSMHMVNDRDWGMCKKADVIVSCYVHGGIVLERDNIKGILISDILKD